MDTAKTTDPGVARAHLDEVTGALEALIGTLDGDGDLGVLLQQVCHQVLAVVPEADMASVTLVKDGIPETIACTDERVFHIDADQYRAGEGPCLEAARTGKIVRVEIAQARQRWPAFAEHAIAAGAASYLAAPLVVDDRHAGSMNLYGLQDHGYRKIDGALLELYLTSVEAVLRATSRYMATRAHVEHLRAALTSRAVIDQAKGILMAARHITADQAFEVLKTQSQNENIKLHELAKQLVKQATTPPD